MVRRTKAEAQATRTRILDTAELVFERRGVSRTTLQDIAHEAGLTRGAIYWHFKDKADLFNAIMDRATMPLEEGGSVCGFNNADITMSQMRDGFVSLLKRVVADPDMKRRLGIATHKVEYVEEMDAVRERHIRIHLEIRADVERTLRQAIERGDIPRRMPPRYAAIGLVSLVDGLLNNWLLEPDGFDLVRVGTQVLAAYFDSLSTVRAPSRQAG